MKKKDLFVKIMAGLLVAGMLIGLLPLFASADEVDTGDNNQNAGTATNPEDRPNDDDLHLHKTAVLQDDGTWTITLEAFATGTVTRTYTEKVKPTDVIMILDQSGSMDSSDQYIENSGFALATTMPTNEQLAEGNTVYYHFDANDQKYYPVTATEVLVTHDTYWAVGKDCTIDGKAYQAGDRFCLESGAEGKVATSWTYNNFTSKFEHDRGYLLGDYMLYQMSGSWSNYTYTQRLGTDATQNGQVLSGVSGYNRDAALKALRNKYPGYQVDQVTTFSGVNRIYYALVYIPAELVDNNTYYYTYTYMDDQNQLWTLGHSSTHNNADQEKYNLGNLYVTSNSKGPRLTALKTAATAFINHMYSASNKQMADHRIAVVGFASTSTSGTGYGNEYMYSNTELFVGATQYNYMQGGKESTISSGDYYSNGKLKAGDVEGNIYLHALQNVRTNEGHNNLLTSIGALGAKGGTFPSHGFEMAVEIAKTHKDVYTSGERDLIIIFMTDGEPSWAEKDSWDASNGQRGPKGVEADKTIALANTLKTEYKATIKTVALLGSTPTEDSDSKIDDEDDFLDAVTSSVTASGTNHYVLAKNGVDLKNFFNTIHVSVESNISSITLSENAYMVDRVSEYFNMPLLAAKQPEETEDAYRQRVSNWMREHVTVYTADHIGKLEFMTAVEQDVTCDISVSDPEDDGKIHLWPTFSESDGLAHGITVHNFDYLSDENMVTTEHFGYIDANQSDGSKDVYTAPVAGQFEDTNGNGRYDFGEKVTAQNVDYLISLEEAKENPDAHYTMIVSGKKLKVVIRGVTAKDSAANKVYVPTNDAYSGLWDKASNNTYGMLKAFPMPQVNVYSRVYVLDYAKDAKLESVSPIRKALALDSSEDAVFSQLSYQKTENGNVYSKTSLNTGAQADNMKFGNAYINMDERVLYYKPMTTNWFGYDTFYLFWTSQTDENNTGMGDPVTGNGWSKFTVMPANNVYFEDTFINLSSDGTTETGRVGIEFGTGWSFKTENSDGTLKDNEQPVEGDNKEQTESAELEGDDTHGWIESLKDETGFTDGTVAVGSGSAKATASFVFTGTGVDLYSYTDKDAGTIIVKVEPLQIREGYSIPARYYIVDNYSASGGYYSVPTVSYMARGKDANGEEALVYGKYKVTITVTTAAAVDGGRMMYYLDGIRVYNPLGSEQENNPTVSEGYGGEVHSFFYNIRDYLLSENDFVANSENAGAVFIDQIKEGQVEGEEAGVGVSTSVISTYQDYGPKNEVYLAGVTEAVTTTDEAGNQVTTSGSVGQMIVMKVDVVEGRRWFVSMRAASGKATTAAISLTQNDKDKATVTVDHSADMYYEVTPIETFTVTENGVTKTYGYISIQNTGPELLAIATFQITGLDPNPSDNYEQPEEKETNAIVFAISGEEAVSFANRFTRMASAPYAGAQNSASDNNNEMPEIEIENLELEEPDQPAIDDEIREWIEALVARLFQSVRDWFHA